MRKLFPILAGAVLVAVIGVTLFPRPEKVEAQGAPGPELARYGDVIVDLNRVIAITHKKGEFVEFTLDAARPDGTAVIVVLSKDMSEEPDYIEQHWMRMVKDLRVGN